MADAPRPAPADIAVPDLLDAILHPIAVVDGALREVALNRRPEPLTGLGRDEARGLHADLVLRSSLGGRSRTTLWAS
jgi:PAS domain-containing protein